MTGVSKRFKDSNWDSGASACTVAFVIFVCIKRNERRRFIAPMALEELSVMVVREKSAMTMCSLRGASAARSLSPNLEPSNDALITRSEEPRLVVQCSREALLQLRDDRREAGALFGSSNGIKFLKARFRNCR